MLYLHHSPLGVPASVPAQLIIEPDAPHAEDNDHRNHHPFMELPSRQGAAATMSSGAVTRTAAIVMAIDLRQVIRLRRSPSITASLLRRPLHRGRSFGPRRVFALIAIGLGFLFLPEGVVFRRARPGRHILRRATQPFRRVVPNFAPRDPGARAQNGAGDN